MRYTPLSIATADLVVARKMTIGADKRLFANRRPMLELGAIYLAGDGSGVWTPDPINLTAGALASNGDIVLVVDNELAADAGDVEATLAVTFADDSNGQVQVTCKAPSWVADKSPISRAGLPGIWSARLATRPSRSRRSQVWRASQTHCVGPISRSASFRIRVGRRSAL